MKILHTSDWHLGHQLYGYDRTEEQRAMLLRMQELVRTHRPDVFLLCGDVFHVSQPPAGVQKLFVDAMHAIMQEAPGMKMIVTAGNHDSGTRHEVFSTPWKSMGVEAIGVLRHDDPGAHIVEVDGKGYVVALPYTNERYIPEGYIQGLLDEVAARNTGGLPVVLAAHTTVKGADFAGHDGSDGRTVGGIDSVEVAYMGTGYDYLALGHIHKPQYVHTGRHNVRYSGSPLPVSFDEDYAHGVSVVEIEKRGATPVVKVEEIVNIRPLVSLPPSGFTSWEDALGLLADYPEDIPAYIRLNVESDNALPSGAAEQAAAATGGKMCRFCHINHRRTREAAHSEKALTVAEFRRMSPLEVAKRFVEEEGGVFDSELEGLFKETLNSLNY